MHVCCVYIRTTFRDYSKDYSKFRFLPKDKLHYDTIPLGISYVSSCLQQVGYTTEILYVTPHIYSKGIESYIEKQPQVFAVSIMANHDYDLTIKTINTLRIKYKNSKILVGGVVVTLNPERFIHDMNEIDALCIGSGEKAVVEYVKQVEKGEYKKTNNLWIRTENEILKCDEVLSVENIDELPYPDRKGWNKFIKEEKDYTCSIVVNRGCIYNCVFCENKQLREKTTNRDKYFNERKEEEIIKEIDYCIKENSNIKGIYLSGENIAANTNKFKNLLVLLSKYNDSLGNNKLYFIATINFTPNLLDDEIIKLMKKANFRNILFSLESGSFDIRKQIGKPKYTNEEFIAFCKKLEILNINRYIYAMYCFPFETKKTWFETIYVLKQSKPIGFSYSWLYTKNITINRQILLIDIFRFVILKPLVFFLLKKFFKVVQYSINSVYMLTHETIMLFKLSRIINKKVNVILAKQEFDKGNYEQSIKYFNRIKIKKDNCWIYGDRAIAKMNIGDYKGAIKDFNKILSLDYKEAYIQKKKECLDLMYTKKIK